MNDIEQKALALLKGADYDYELGPMVFKRDRDVFSEALCRAIEQHEAFRQEVSDTMAKAIKHIKDGRPAFAAGAIGAFVIPKPKPKPDPLAQTLGDFDGTLWEPEDVLRFRAALEARGLEIRQKNDD